MQLRHWLWNAMRRRNELHQPRRQSACFAQRGGDATNGDRDIGEASHDAGHAEVDAIALPQVHRRYPGECVQTVRCVP